ncbi:MULTISPECIES: ATP-dependent helicase [Streptomyces]|uniref:DNA 3'-5' helicase n=2 Tax=Streptomyces rimosus TaxID=1927 RepID=A0A8A1V0A2_STRR1|nr:MULTISPECIES: ATP-dependent DNA helicase [Streptomyces]MYT46518.1 UvrD-helicase domain-containing protein [Streptomyces sp. SID5471]QDA09535.1 ATP-dependent helicase [Streptomyces rimosus]QEV80801.1 ATP-dependent helicase [Streptomyces rimosus]QGY71799.1 AAA family ATPase [Streptomyces rimosus R6-500]QST86187.1 ATP-dependent helicase [Streptomyces rimosus subsp. rimosus ATCC 10970]
MPSAQPRRRAARRDASGAYRLVRTRPGPADPPALDARQRAVVDHRTGPLLVLAGPGTGKTTTLVEAVARRVRDGADPERLLVLTFSRKAAVELRDRIAARLGSAAAPQATTFHSYCYALVRAHQDADLFADPLRLLSGPEQDLVVRELLEGQAGLAAAGRARVRWPDELRACLTTRGFADEVRAVLARSRELGLGPEALADFARRTGRPDWGAAADFLAEYLDVLDAQGVLDYAELVHRAVLLAERDEVAAELAARYDAVFVDEYQDTDASQIRLLRALAGGGRTLVAFGDPDQSIYAFRGADVNGILDFPLMFPRTGGDPAPVEVLGTSRRSGAAVLAATRRLTSRMPLTRLPAQKVREHRDLAAVRDGGRVEVYTYPTPGAELDNIADILRRAHLEDGVPWRDMAVLVRAGARSIPGVRRALTSAGVPLEIDGDELPLRREPAVAPLLTALRVAASAVTASTEAASAVVAPAPADEALAEDAPAADAPVPADGSTEAAHGISTETAIELLTSPLGGMDAADLRRLGRALREEERVAGHDVPPPSDELIARALAEPERLVAHDPAYARGARHLGELLRTTRDLLAAGGTAEEALWTLWDGTPTWSQRLERTARRGGAAARNADRDLDAVVALFETAARAEARTGGRGALNFLEELDAQDIAADTLTRRTVRPDAVRLMTAHRSKGLEWRLVVVAGVQEGLWPDLRRRGSLLEADRIGRDGLAEPLPPGALLTEERRLFYVAATRARDRLVVTAVKAASDDGDQPSRFLTELGVELRDVTGRPRRPLSVAALVAELRATTVDPQATPALREAAAQRLAKLAALRDDDGQPLVPAAHPDQWWGLYEPTHSAVPLRDRDRPVTLSGSALDQLANTCALQWFLGREVKADSPATAAQGFGNVVHVLADEVASGRTPADLSVLMERLDSVWDALAFDAPWKSRQEKDNARAALERFLRWHVMERATLGRETVATEHGFDVTLEAGEYAVRIRGSMDRVERDAEGRAYVVDFKTGKQKPTGPEVARHPQLAVYQLAVREGAVDAVFEGRRPEPGGAELVHLRLGAPQKEGGDALPAVQAQGPVDGEWVGELLATAAGRVLEERFTPTTGQHCTHCTFRNSCSALPEGQHVVE